MAMTPRGWSLSALEVELGRDRRTIARRIREAGVRPVETKGKTRLYRLAQVVAAISRHESKSSDTAPHMATSLLESLMVPVDQWCAWAHDATVPWPEFQQSLRDRGFADSDLALLLRYGLQLLPPAEGETVARVSVPHAERWLVLFAGLIENLGGDGASLALTDEAERLRGAA